MSEWQPIETAPRDGTTVLGYCTADGDFLCIVFDKHRGRFVETLEHHFGDWTHWMPLPPPPEVE